MRGGVFVRHHGAATPQPAHTAGPFVAPRKMFSTAIARNRRLGAAVLVEARAVLATTVPATELQR